MAPLLYAQKGKGDEPLSDELYTLIEQRTKSIARELDGLTVRDEWLGQYWDGDHHPTVLLWAPSSGFVITASHHTFAPSWVNYGKARFENGRLKLFPEMSKGTSGAYTVSPEYVGVRWFDWRFLIPPDQLTIFAYAVHSGSESQIQQYFVKPGDREKIRKGLPELPSQYRTIMTMPAIRARVVKVQSKGEGVWGTVITLDAGKKQAIVEGMEFYYALRGNRRNIRLRVESVSATRSTARVSMLGGTDEQDFGPKHGMIFSSKMPKGFIEPE